MKIVKAWTREEIIANLQAYAAQSREPIKYDEYKLSPGHVPHYWLRKIMGDFTQALVAAGLRDKVRKPSHSKQPANEQGYVSPYRMGEAKIRTCLRCDDKFESRWAGNRFCIPCTKSKDWITAMIQAGFEECA